MGPLYDVCVIQGTLVNASVNMWPSITPMPFLLQKLNINTAYGNLW